MTEPASSPLRRVVEAPFTRRTWSEVGHTLVGFPVAASAFAVIVPMLENGFFWAVSAPVVRWYGAVARFLARELLGEDIPTPPPLRPLLRLKVATPDAAAAAALAKVVAAAGGKAREWETKPGVTTKRLPLARVTELAAEAGITITSLVPAGETREWFGARIADPVAWRVRAYFGVKLPLAAVGLAVTAAGWLGGVFCLTFPAWRPLLLGTAFGGSLAGSFTFLPLGCALLLAAPWATHGLTEIDLWLMRGLLGSGSPAERIRALEERRARAVDDSAARLRGIERDLHDGTQAQLVALANRPALTARPRRTRRRSGSGRPARAAPPARSPLRARPAR